MHKQNYDITRVPEDGYLIFPLSMGRLGSAQSPQVLYDFLVFFENKLTTISLDVILLYTNDLYLNSDERAITVRTKMRNLMLSHHAEFQKLLIKQKRYVPSAFHFLPWDYVTINADGYDAVQQKLWQQEKSDNRLRSSLASDLNYFHRESTEANLSFLIEEISATYLIMQKLVPLPHTLATEHGWRLMCYPCDPNTSLSYAFSASLFSVHDMGKEQHNIFSRSFYNIEKHTLIHLS